MIHPSYTELLEKINANGEDSDSDMVLNSRYSLVLATSKRARQLIAGSKPLVKGAAGRKPLSVAIDELYNGKVKILPPKEEEEEKTFIGGGDVLGVAQVSELLGGGDDDVELEDGEELEDIEGVEEDDLDHQDRDDVYELEDDEDDQ